MAFQFISNSGFNRLFRINTKTTDTRQFGVGDAVFNRVVRDREAVQSIRFRCHSILTSGITLLVGKDVKGIFLVIKLDYIRCNRGRLEQAQATNQLRNRFNQVDSFSAVNYLGVVKNTHFV